MECFREFIQKSSRNVFILSTTYPIEFLITSNPKNSENLNMLRFNWIFNPVKEEVSGGSIRRKYPEDVSGGSIQYPEGVSGGCAQINGTALTM